MMFEKKRTGFMEDVRRKGRMKIIQRNRKKLQPSIDENGAYSHIASVENKQQIIALIEKINSMSNFNQIPIREIANMINSKDL